jgi:NAD(P)-dependent dehydrogenase (short-subunit alcohol dehydrogenase family)
MSDIFDLTDRVAVVTGAGGGLGTAICAGLAAFGADVAAIDIDLPTLEASAAGVEAAGRRALAIHGDASEENEVVAAFARVDEVFGKVDILVNLAYTPTFDKPEHLSLDDWHTSFRINVTSYFLSCRESGRRMIARGRGGAIMNMCSIAGTSAMGRGSFPYSIAKGGIAMMTRELAIEWARHGIRVNAIQPCQFLTPGLRHRLDDPGLGHIRDKFLSGMVTGTLLPVDGGNLALNAGGTKD